MSEKWYLELSEETGSHKFYEVIVDGADLSIRYGRIGDNGQTSKKTFDTPEKAKAEAEKKLKEKKKSGYTEAVMGERQKRAVTRRPLAEASASEVRAASGTKKAPVLWKFATKVMAFGICVTPSRVWVGNEDGKVFALSLEGVVEAEFKLPAGVKCIIEDGDFVYAGCNDGNVYDLNSKVPRVAYEIAEDVDIYWLDIHDALLAITTNSSGRLKVTASMAGWFVLKRARSTTGIRVASPRTTRARVRNPGSTIRAARSCSVGNPRNSLTVASRANGSKCSTRKPANWSPPPNAMRVFFPTPRVTTASTFSRAIASRASTASKAMVNVCGNSPRLAVQHFRCSITTSGCTSLLEMVPSPALTRARPQLKRQFKGLYLRLSTSKPQQIWWRAPQHQCRPRPTRAAV
jgi:predicted DNA-binding WGR domain protein